jgi:pSer/pThr/pTyr-binding forkhead associated (FHA) protein
MDYQRRATPHDQGQAGLFRGVIALEPATFNGSLDRKVGVAMNPSNPMAASKVSPARGREIWVGSTPLVIGRHPRCDVRLGSLRVSRYHCCLTDVGGEVVVRDLGSTNGLRINGQRVSSGRLKPGDTLAIAQVEFLVEAHAGVGLRLRQFSDPESEA